MEFSGGTRVPDRRFGAIRETERAKSEGRNEKGRRHMAYDLEGQLLEVCTCKILCPCWVGEDPDGDGTCQSVNSWHIDKGQINGVDVSHLTIAGLDRKSV